jgi:hypothetical protein
MVLTHMGGPSPCSYTLTTFERENTNFTPIGRRQVIYCKAYFGRAFLVCDFVIGIGQAGR